MEDFELTLTLFEKMIPSFFSGAQAAYQSKLVQTKAGFQIVKIEHSYWLFLGQ